MYTQLFQLFLLSPPMRGCVLTRADHVSALDALRDALTHLDEVFEAIGDKYSASLDAGAFERQETPRVDGLQRRQFAA